MPETPMARRSRRVEAGGEERALLAAPAETMPCTARVLAICEDRAAARESLVELDRLLTEAPSPKRPDR